MLTRPSNLDIDHLRGLSCISVSIASTDFVEKLTLPVKSGSMNPTMESLHARPWWPIVNQLWKVRLKHVFLTSVGTLIGILYHDSLTQKRTVLNW